MVFLGHDTEVTPGWLALLLAPLSAPEVAATQSLLLHKDGSVRSAGVAFPPGRGVPHALLRGFPREDATGVDGHPLHGLSGAALAVRRDDLVRLRGFDPTFRNDMADVDLCLRLAALRPGRLLTVPGSRVIQHGPRRGRGSAQQVIDRKVFLDRWHARLPVDDAAAWGAAGYRVVGREIREHLSRDKRVCAVEPVVQRLRRPDPLKVVESPPCLRWALKQAAPFGRVGAKWGDTHFCQLLAEALRRHGQEVVVDHRPAFDRPSIRHDDVTLLLRGLAPYTPHPEHVNLMWVISHPELLEDAETPGWDQVYVASTTHAATLAERWPVPVAVLLQATDPKRFHPDRAEPDSGFPLLFVGNSRRQRRPMVVGALDRGLPLTLVGGDWQGIVAEDQVQAAYLDHDALGAAYRSAGIVLGDHWEDMRRLGFLSNRLFDAVASGARVITDDVAGLRDVFDDHVRVARDADELVRLVDEPDRDRLFGTDDERRAAAARVAAEHSFDARAGLLVDRAVELWRKRGQGR